MNKIIIANWKMNPSSVEEARKLAAETDVEGLIICPPFPFLEAVAKTIKKAKLGAQDVFWMNPPAGGAYTGEVSADELKNLCAEYVIVGHSERRQNLGETDEMVAKKIKAAVDAGLIPILCVGETRAERDSGKTKEIIRRELEIGLSLISQLSNVKSQKLVIAYEPIWAIGTGIPDTPENMLDMVKFINGQVSGARCQVIYGGSVTSKNAGLFLKHKEIDGALVGGASLKKEEITKIVEIAKNYA